MQVGTITYFASGEKQVNTGVWLAIEALLSYPVEPPEIIQLR